MRLCLLFLILLLCTACGADAPPGEKPPPAAAAPLHDSSCRDCHAVALDAGHAAIACIACHAGKDPAPDAETAHTGMRKQPAHPLFLDQTCGSCHAEQHAKAKNSLHFTVKNEVNAVRRAFGAEQDLDSLLDIPQHEEIGG